MARRFRLGGNADHEAIFPHPKIATTRAICSSSVSRDFYELFFDDAKTGARLPAMTLTARYKDSDNPVPRCGVPRARGRRLSSRACCAWVTPSPSAIRPKTPRRQRPRQTRCHPRRQRPAPALEENLLDARKANSPRPPCFPMVRRPRRRAHVSALRTVDLATGSFFIQDSPAKPRCAANYARFGSRAKLFFPEDPPLPAGVKAPPLVPGLPDGVALTRFESPPPSTRAKRRNVSSRVFSESGR